jgi:class 3 adenylate cyclase/Tfp pilus assembly protein PilF
MENLDRLVSIIFSADIIGYTSMMQQNELHALQKLNHYQETLEKCAETFDGEIVKTYGDGCLILFSSAVKAIHCAMNIQNSLQSEPTVPLRIGVHMGEIIRKDGDVFGNGINIASRIESMGVANSVLISSDVFTQIKNHPEFEVAELGNFKFKNVDEEIALYALTNNELVVPKPKEMKGKGTIKKNHSLLASWNMKLVALSLSLILVSLIIYKFSPAGTVPNELTANIEALDYYLQGEFHQKQETLSDIDTAIVYYKKAIDEDPNFAMAYNNLASAYMRKHLSFDPNFKWEKEAYSAAGKALSVDSNLANPHLIRGQFYWSPSHNFAHEEAINEFSKAIANDPNLSQAYEQLALVQLHVGLFDDALKNASKSIELDPGNFRAKRFVGEAMMFQGNYKASMKEFEKIPESFAPLPTQSFKALNFIYLNQPEKAIEILDKYLLNNPDNPNLNSVYAMVVAGQGKVAEAEQYQQTAVENSKEFIHAHHVYYNLGVAAALMDRKSQALKWLKKAAETGFPNYPLFNSDPYLTSLKLYPEFSQLLEELKEEWEYFKSL